MPNTASQHGFTLPQLLITVAVTAFLLMIGVPGLSEMVRSIQVSGAASQMATDLHLARGEAINRGVHVILCQRSTATADTCASQGVDSDWGDNGWLVFASETQNAPLTDPGTLIRQAPALKDPISATFSATPELNNAVRFLPDGSVKNAAGDEFTDVSFLYCDVANITSSRQVVLQRNGHIRSERSDDSCGT